MKIAVIGDAMLDVYVHGTVERISPEAPVPVFKEERREYRLGGAANAAAQLKALGAEVHLFCNVGWDSQLAGMIQSSGIILRSISMAGPVPTTTKTRYVCGGQQLMRVDKDFVSATRIRANLSGLGYSAVLISDYCKSPVPQITDFFTLPVVVDTKRKRAWGNYDYATVFTPNEAEYNCSGGPRGVNCIVTLGAGGMRLVQPGQDSCDIPGHPVEVSDATGAGDIVAATVTYGLAKGMPLIEAARMANKAAALSVTKLGTTSVPMKTVFVNGCFDILHPGHLELLHEAKKYGDRLVVGINSDSSIRNLKGREPIVNEQGRKAMLDALGIVDDVYIFSAGNAESLIRQLCPDVIVKGEDYKGKHIDGEDFVRDRGGEVILVPFHEHRDHYKRSVKDGLEEK